MDPSSGTPFCHVFSLGEILHKNFGAYLVHTWGSMFSVIMFLLFLLGSSDVFFCILDDQAMGFNELFQSS